MGWKLQSRYGGKNDDYLVKSMVCDVMVPVSDDERRGARVTWGWWSVRGDKQIEEEPPVTAALGVGAGEVRAYMASLIRLAVLVLMPCFLATALMLMPVVKSAVIASRSMLLLLPRPVMRPAALAAA